MKRGTPSHPKIGHLRALLDVPLYSAVGVLELLWHFTEQYARHGDVGRYSDAQIAEAVGWRESPDRLIEALTEARWLDKSRKHRLIVHHWSEHANDSVHMSLGRACEKFADGQPPKLGRLTADERAKALAAYGPKSVRTPSAQEAHAVRPAKPSQAEPGQAEPLPLPAPLPGPAEPQGGAGIVETGGNGRGGIVGEESAEFLKQSILTTVDMNARDRQSLIERRDISPANLRAVIIELQKDTRVKSVGAVLVRRLCRRSA